MRVQQVPDLVSGLSETALRAGLRLAIPPLRLVSAVTGTAAGLGEGILTQLDAVRALNLPPGPRDTRDAVRARTTTTGATTTASTPAASASRQWRPPGEPAAPTSGVAAEQVGTEAPGTDIPAEAVVVGAPGTNREAADQIAADLRGESASSGRPGEDVAAPPGDPSGLPIPDWDHLTIGRLQSRVRPLPVEDLIVLRAWEKAHAARLQVLTMLDNRIVRKGAEQEASAP